jgi:pseudouridine synthase
VRTSAAGSELDITIHEGRNRQVRRMFEATEHPVLSLVRLRFGPIALGELKIGNWREATEREIAALRVILKKASGAEKASDDE